MGNVYHIPIRSFSQRLEIFLAFCGQKTVVKFLVAGILKRRVPKILRRNNIQKYYGNPVVFGGVT